MILKITRKVTEDDFLIRRYRKHAAAVVHADQVSTPVALLSGSTNGTVQLKGSVERPIRIDSLNLGSIGGILRARIGIVGIDSRVKPVYDKRSIGARESRGKGSI